MEGIETYEQAQRATYVNADSTVHPGKTINYFNAQPTVLTRPTTLYSAAATNILAAGGKSIPLETEKCIQMKNRKKKKQARNAEKEQVFITEDRENYNIDSILEELGEAETNSGKKNGSKAKKAKGQGKRSGKSGKKEDSSKDKESSPLTSSEDEDEEDEEETKGEKESISAENELMPPSSGALNRQTSRSTEDMFTPVIKKHNKWKNKKSLITKDDSGHTYSSSSSASSTTSSSAVANHNTTHSLSSLSAKPKYNLRRKSALRPSQSFDMVKSATSSVASDDTLENTNKDHLDLATDFPPLSSEAAGTMSLEDDQYVPKWVIKSDQHPVTSSSSSFSSSSAVIDASDQQPIPEETASAPPPPDVVIMQTNGVSQQCTPNVLPDIAAQAPNVMNTTNSSSGVSSNAGDLTPPQQLMSEPTSFYNEDSKNNAVIIFDSDQPEGNGGSAVEFGFEVNVLDLISSKQQVNHDDEAIVSFGNTITTEDVLNSPESGICSDINLSHQEMKHSANNNASTSTASSAVKIPNYAQIVRYVAQSWKSVELELKKGTAQKY